MKKEFITPSIELIIYEQMDIITGSADFEEDPFDQEGMDILFKE